MSGEQGSQPHRAYLIESHTVLDKQSNTGVEETDITLEHEVALRLSGYPGLELPEPLLCLQSGTGNERGERG